MSVVESAGSGECNQRSQVYCEVAKRTPTASLEFLKLERNRNLRDYRPPLPGGRLKSPTGNGHLDFVRETLVHRLMDVEIAHVATLIDGQGNADQVCNPPSHLYCFGG